MADGFIPISLSLAELGHHCLTRPDQTRTHPSPAAPRSPSLPRLRSICSCSLARSLMHAGIGRGLAVERRGARIARSSPASTAPETAVLVPAAAVVVGRMSDASMPMAMASASASASIRTVPAVGGPLPGRARAGPVAAPVNPAARQGQAREMQCACLAVMLDTSSLSVMLETIKVLLAGNSSPGSPLGIIQSVLMILRWGCRASAPVWRFDEELTVHG